NSTEAVPGAPSRICAPAPNGVPCVEANGQASRTLPLLPAFLDPNAVIVAPGSGSNLFDVAQLQGKAVLNERAMALRLDHRLSSQHSLYARFFRDDGNIEQPEGVTGRRVIFINNPQNGVIALQSTLKTTVLNEFKFGYNGMFSRTNGQAPTINGIDLSKLSINVSGNTANFSIPG